jgi:hypothetical protein
MMQKVLKYFQLLSTFFVGDFGAGEGNRTLIISLEGWSITTMLHPLWWKEQDLNLRRLTSADLQSAAFNHSAILPFVFVLQKYPLVVNV